MISVMHINTLHPIKIGIHLVLILALDVGAAATTN